ncbi:MAG: type II secretion system protein [Gemmataceae bacterium]
MRRRTRLSSRPGFTLVELLVSMALIIFIMYILAESFSAGAKAFRDLKAVGDMNERLRVAANTIRRMLAADHFEGHKRLSDPNFWADGPPRSGFFRIWQDQPTANDVDEGVDLDSDTGAENHSFRTTTHHLHFTVRNRGNQRGDFFTATVPATSPLLNLPQPDSRFQDGANQFTSPWAEVAIYLRSTGETTVDPNAPSATGLPLHTLFLRQRLLVPSHKDVQDTGVTIPTDTLQNRRDYCEVSQTPDQSSTANPKALYFNGPQDVTMPSRRFNNPSMQLSHPVSPGSYNRLQEDNPPFAGSDVLLTDVISFDVRLLLDASAYNPRALSPSVPVDGPAPYFVSLHNEDTPPGPWRNNPLLRKTDGLIWDRYLMKYTPKNKPQEALNKEVPPNVRLFDTWSASKDDSYDYTQWNVIPAADPPDTNTRADRIPLYKADPPNADTRPIRIVAIKVTIRIWDHRTQQSRQVSVIQDM